MDKSSDNNIYKAILGDEGYLYHRILNDINDYKEATHCTTAYALSQAQICLNDMRDSYRELLHEL